MDGTDRKAIRPDKERKVESLDKSLKGDRQKAGDFHDRSWRDRSGGKRTKSGGWKNP